MGIRFRRSVKIAPGIRLNAGLSGLGLSLGGRGAGVSFGPGGTRVHAGIPGTGLSWSESVGSRRGSQSRKVSSTSRMAITVRLSEETGELSYLDEAGNSLPKDVEAQARRQAKDTVLELLEKSAREINGQLSQLEHIHRLTPNPRVSKEFAPVAFKGLKPPPPSFESLGLTGRLLPPVARRREARNVALQRAYETELADHEQKKHRHESIEQARQRHFYAVVAGNLSAMELALSQRLESLEWPYETLVSFELPSSDQLILDVDLPEIEDLPVREASVPARANKLNIKNVTDKRKRLIYLTHLHAIGFRLLGECFFTLPTVLCITISAYSQRLDPSDGHVRDEYLYSARVTRQDFVAFNFEKLEAIDPVAAFERFELLRSITKTGVIKPIEPYGIT